MSERFVPLAAFLRPVSPVTETPPVVAPEPPHPDVADAISSARRFRAALADALEAAVARLLREIAAGVLARELEMAEADIAAIAVAAVARFEEEKILLIRAHPGDLDALRRLEIECLADPRLRRGELLFEVRSGSIDLRFEARLETAVAACVA
jgi:flagellar biosynthesis/type III secretory pathway protein FliH